MSADRCPVNDDVAVRWRRQQLDALDRGLWVDPEAGKVSFLADFEAWGFEAWGRDQLWTDGTRKAMSLPARSTTFDAFGPAPDPPQPRRGVGGFDDRAHRHPSTPARTGHELDPVRQRVHRVPRGHA